MAMHNWQKFGSNTQLRPPYAHLFRAAPVRVFSSGFQIGMICESLNVTMKIMKKC